MKRKDLFGILGTLATHVCRTYAGDLFIDLEEILKKFENGETITILTRTTGSDLIDRYSACLKESGECSNPSEEDCIKKCSETLGLDVMTKINPIDGKVYVKWNDRGNRMFRKCHFTNFIEHLQYEKVILEN